MILKIDRELHDSKLLSRTLNFINSRKERQEIEKRDLMKKFRGCCRIITLEQTKNGERLLVPLNKQVFETLSKIKKAKAVNLKCPFVFHQDGKPISPGKVTASFRRVCKRAEIENFRFHDLRHDFASNLVQNGNDLYVVQNLLGHKDGRMTQRYAHLKIDNLRDAVKTLE